jgi:hypothetical protein
LKPLAQWHNTFYAQAAAIFGYFFPLGVLY